MANPNQPSAAALVFDTAWGDAAIAWRGTQVTGFRLPGDPDLRRANRPPAPPSWVQRTIERVQAHLRGRSQDFRDLPYDWEAVSDFARRVYLATLAIPPGTTRGYGQIARQLGRPAAARAVGAALAANPWPLLIPCHRVVAANGHMTGFSGPGGLATKRRLLVLEGAQLFSE